MTTMMLRNSERGSFKTCRHRWNWTWHRGRQASMAPYALRFGDLIHQALAAYYIPGSKRGPAPAETFERVYHEQAARLADDGFDVYSDEKWVDALDLGAGMLNGYVERYRSEDEEYRVISSEQTFKVRLRVPPLRAYDVQPGEDRPLAFVPGFAFWMVGTFDGVWEHMPTRRKLFKEFKTATAITDDGLSMDEQASTYWTYGPKWLERRGIIQPGEGIKGILYTRLRKAIPDPNATYDDQGRVLNKPTKTRLQEEYKRIGRRYPKGSGANGAVVLDDLIADLPNALYLGEPSKSQRAPFFSRVPVYRDPADRRRQHERILSEARDIWLARHGSPLVSLYKNPGPLHMPNCRGCAVRDPCEVHEAGGDFESVFSATTTRWSPYEAHELVERL